MANNNVVLANVYQINQRTPIPLAQVTSIGLPSSGCTLIDCTNSPTNPLSTGIFAYCGVQVPTGDIYYVMQTVSAMASLMNA